MAVQDLLNNADSTQIQELFKFQAYGTTFYFTSSDEDIIYEGNTYESVPGLTRNNLKRTFSIDDARLDLIFPISNNFAKRTLTIRPEERFRVDLIWRVYNQTEEYFLERYSSLVYGSLYRQSTETITLSSIHNVFAGSPYNTAYILKSCRHNLYNRDCKVTRENFEVQATLLEIPTNTITHPIFSEKEDQWYKAGYILVNDFIFREIINHVGDTITLDSEIRNFDTFAIVGSPFKAYAGCDHSIETCKNKFNNNFNYGGFPDLPLRDPARGI